MFDNLTEVFVRAQINELRHDHQRQFAGRRIWLQFEPNFPAHYANSDQAVVSKSLLAYHPGLSFEEYKARGGSATALRYMVRDESVTIN